MSKTPIENPIETPNKNLIDAATLLAHLAVAGTSGLRIVDCRFSLADPKWGRAAYQEGTIPGAVYANLDEDLSAVVETGRTGRHPLPTPEAFGARLGSWGIGPETLVVAFDDRGGPFAARLWWMLRWLGHSRVAVLNGGIGAWREAGGELAKGCFIAEQNARPYPSDALRREMMADAEEVRSSIGDPQRQLWDARAPARYRGEEEPMDAVGGHIPGAYNLPFAVA